MITIIKLENLKALINAPYWDKPFWVRLKIDISTGQKYFIDAYNRKVFIEQLQPIQGDR